MVWAGELGGVGGAALHDHLTGGQGFEESPSIRARLHAPVEYDHDPSIALGANKSAKALLELKGGPRHLIFDERPFSLFLQLGDAGGFQGVIRRCKRELVDDDEPQDITGKVHPVAVDLTIENSPFRPGDKPDSLPDVSLGGKGTGEIVVRGNTGERPIRLAAVERHLEVGGRDGVEPAMAALAEDCTFTGDLYHTPATKKHLTGVLLARAVDQLLAA